MRPRNCRRGKNDRTDQRGVRGDRGGHRRNVPSRAKTVVGAIRFEFVVVQGRVAIFADMIEVGRSDWGFAHSGAILDPETPEASLTREGRRGFSGSRGLLAERAVLALQLRGSAGIDRLPRANL